MDPLLAELTVAQPRDRIIFVEALVGTGGRLDVPFDQRGVQRLGDLMGEDRLAGARLALDEQGTAERNGGVDGDPQVVRRDIVGGSGEAHGAALAGQPAA
jgi:hypothetical protein